MGNLIKKQQTGTEEVFEQAKKNIKTFLRMLDAQAPEDFDDIFGQRDYYANLFEKTWLARMLDAYDKRKEQVGRKLKNLLKVIELEGENGFRNLSPQEEYMLNEKRRKQAEEIALSAHLGVKDIGDLVTPIVAKIYERGKFYDWNKYGLRHGEIIRIGLFD